MDAHEDTVEVYRLANSSPPTAEDFRPTRIEFPHRTFAPEALCIACGVSVFKTAEDALRTREKFNALREKRIARGTIRPSDGLILGTGKPSHTTWWVQTDIPHAGFTDVTADVSK